MPPDTEYRIVMHFAELAEIEPGERKFDVQVGGRRVIEALDVAREAGDGNRAIVRECHAKAESGALRISLIPRQGQPILNGVEIVAVSTGPG
jgi:hypothetical protein